MGDTRSLVYVDLKMLGAEFQAQLEKSQKGWSCGHGSA